MKKSSFYTSMFFSCLGISIIMALSSSNWVVAWFSMELNMICFLGWISVYPSFTGADYEIVGAYGGPVTSLSLSYEPYVKYFLVQSLGSSLFLVYPIAWLVWGLDSLSTIFLLAGLLIKAGAAPFHQWFPSMCLDLEWTPNIILMYWQKLAPMFLAVSLCEHHFGWGLIILSLLNMLIGCLGALGQTQFRSIMAYSSIGQVGWVVGLILVSELGSKVYLALYGFIIMPILYLFSVCCLYKFSDLFSRSSGLSQVFWAFVMLFGAILSLAGMPPFLGFFLKLYSMTFFLADGGLVVYVASLCILSTLNLCYYLNLSINFLLVKFTSLGASPHYFSSYGARLSPAMLGLSITSTLGGLPLVALSVVG